MILFLINHTIATPIATTPTQHLPRSFFSRPAEVVAPELIGCMLVKRQDVGELLWGVIVETEAYSQEEPACHGHRRGSPSNEPLHSVRVAVGEVPPSQYESLPH